MPFQSPPIRFILILVLIYIERLVSDLEITIQNDGKTSVLTLKGTLDENSDFSKINIKGVQEIIIDTQFVTMMNSCGTRNWVLWMHTIPSTMRVRFINCSMAFIDQANLFEGFFPKKNNSGFVLRTIRM